MLAYGVALVLPALSVGFPGGPYAMKGWECLFEGTSATWYWAANPLLWVGWGLLYFGKRPAKAFTMLAVASCLLFTLVSLQEPGQVLLVGGWLWVASAVIADVAAGLLLFQRRAGVAAVGA